MNGPEEWDGFAPGGDVPRDRRGDGPHGRQGGGPNGPVDGSAPPDHGDRPRIPSPRSAAEDDRPLSEGPRPESPRPESPRPDGRRPAEETPTADEPYGEEPGEEPAARAPSTRSSSAAHLAQLSQPAPSHKVLKSLLGAWALAACSPEETAAVEAHLTDCATCADEALRLRDAVGLLHPADSLDLDPLLRSRVLEGCLVRRPPRIPVPEWASPYDAETAKLDALLRDMGESEWRAPVRLRWFADERPAERETTVGGIIAHLLAVDGLIAVALGLADPLGSAAPRRPLDPTARTHAYWAATAAATHAPRSVREPWRDQSHTLIRTVSFAGRGVAELDVPYGTPHPTPHGTADRSGGVRLPLCDSFVDRAFECWIHAGDIADAVDYPYTAPSAGHLNSMVDLAARLLPGVLADRRRAGLATPAQRLVEAGTPGRSLHLEVEGSGGGNWYIALDSPAALGSREHTVAHVALDSVEFCRLAAGHIAPEDAAAGQTGERAAIREVLSAAASLSRM